MIFEKYKPLILGLWALFSFSVYSGNIYAKQTENTTVPQPVQNATVKGVVKDATGEPLIGVSVVVKGTTNGAVTDVNGNFSIACSANDILVFSYIGYDKIEVKAGNASFHTITMKEDSELLDEVIVIGYGTTTRKHVIGAVDQIRDDVIKDRPVANITQALQGATPSLSIQQRNMNPNNNNININIRGVSSMNNNDPLVVIDGMAANDINAMNLLNPNDIESVSVLKDAGTAAIYGSRSANGVILITTKQGRTDMKPVVTFTASVGNQNPDINNKPVGAVCNLACSYCYYLEKSKLYKDEPKHVMNDKLLEKFIEEYINSQTMPQILFTWHGGETLMRPLAFYKRAMELQQKYAHGRTISNCIQTNGTLLTDEWCEFFKKE